MVARLGLVLALILSGITASAQEKPGECDDATQAEAATAPAPGADSTAPGNAGTTGWSGGTGGSHLGTNPSGATANSKTWQPPTARGLDLAGQPETVAGC